MRRLLIRLRLWGEPVVIIGDRDKAVPLGDYFKSNPHLGLRPVAVLHDSPDLRKPGVSKPNAHDTQPSSLLALKEYARKLSISTALIAIHDLNSFDNLVDRYRFVFGRVVLVKYKNGKFALNHLKSLDFSDVLGLQVKNNLLSLPAQVFKRLTDLVVSVLGLVLLSPCLGLIALAIVIDAPGRVFYRQRRLGRHGRAFTLLKFRTMHLHADKVLAAEFERNPELKQEWDRYQKLKNDPRITRVGRWLRKFSLDELPQLWNVALGEMSLVGPRPIMVDQYELYGPTFKEYIRVSP
jgi:lipopolysaccharide/colanic/teichoic acid biosynthesis glycosyltransferase